MTVNTRSGSSRSAKTAGVVVIAMALFVAAAPVAWAGKPDVVKTSRTVTASEGGSDGFTDCDDDGDNDYTIDLDGKVIVKTWPDGKTQVHENWQGKAWQEGGDGVRIHHAFTLVFGADGSFKAIGLPFGLFENPGGPLVKDAGLLRIDEDGFFVAGPHELMELFGFNPNAATCDALGLSATP